MTCYRPMPAVRMDDGSVSFVEKGKVHSTLSLPCGQCFGCRQERARQWATRCVEEASLWEANCFVTLTYNDEWLPPGNTLCYRDFQLFMKRLRKEAEKPIRFFMCGEYGETKMRPHYHALLFNWFFVDRELLVNAVSAYPVYRSAQLERLWPFGFSSFGAVSFESARYVASYCLKKVTGTRAAEHYRSVCLETGEVIQREPEFARMSLKPGIGSLWIKKYMTDVYPDGRTVVAGVPGKSPRFYDSIYKQVSPDGHEELQYSRFCHAMRHVADNTPRRLAEREKIARARARNRPSNSTL